MFYTTVIVCFAKLTLGYAIGRLYRVVNFTRNDIYQKSGYDVYDAGTFAKKRKRLISLG